MIHYIMVFSVFEDTSLDGRPARHQPCRAKASSHLRPHTAVAPHIGDVSFGLKVFTLHQIVLYHSLKKERKEPVAS